MLYNISIVPKSNNGSQVAYLDFHLVESLAVVNSNDASDHFWDDDHVTQVCLYYLN